MADEKITDLTFPSLGVDRSYGLNQQRPNTTADALNVRGYEPTTDRNRGGRRPALTRSFSDQIPAGSKLIQHLNTIVIGDVSALWDSDPIPPPGFVFSDPSDAGPPSSWGAGVIGQGWDGTPITGSTQHTRNPGPRKTRKKGSGRQPNKNHLGPADPNGTTYLFQCSAQVTINVPGPFFGQTPTFVGCICVTQIYLALAGAPFDSQQFPGWWRALHAFFTLHALAENYTYNIGSNLITGPVRICTASDISPAGSNCDVVFGFPSSGDQGP